MNEEGTDWGEKARHLAAHFPRSSFHPRVLRWLSENAWRGRAGVACSGGADSLCLLLLLWAHLPERRQDLVVLHFDHRLRGKASRQDAAFVRDVARQLGLEARFGVWERSDDGPVSEETARDARFAFFSGELAQLTSGRENGPFLFLGHQRDDIVESQLMRLSRGSGLSGLIAPRPVQVFADGRVHLRPLLALSGEEIREALASRQIPFRVDASNDRPGYYRNRLRLEVLPLWQKHSPFNVSLGAAAARDLLEEDEDALEIWLRECFPKPRPGQPLDLRQLKGKPRALLRRALREWCIVEGVAPSLSRAAFERLLGAAAEGRSLKMSAGEKVFLEISGEGLLRKTERSEPPPFHFEHPWPLPFNGFLLLPGGGTLRARPFLLDLATRERILSGRVAAGTEAFLSWRGERIQVRHWRPGDRFRALGAPGSRKLQDIFVDMKIPESERYRLPVVLMDNEIVWVPGLPPCETRKINPRSKSVAQLTYSCGKAV